MDLEILVSCLDKLEQEESKLLAWGDTGGFFTEEELRSIFRELYPNIEPFEILLEMENYTMLYRVPNSSYQQVYRTRMGEAVYLYRNLRQWFENQSIEETKRLVSDFRFVRRPRSYPKRDISPKDLLDDWKNKLSLNELESKAIEYLLAPINNYKLAGFQVRSSERIIHGWRKHKSSNVPKTVSGTIVCAGTGSGKTLSFYLPAMTSLLRDVVEDNSNRVRILAIYPRKELLKDQFLETYLQARKLDNLLESCNVNRKIRIGAYYGDTPKSIADILRNSNEFGRRRNINFEILRCPSINCTGNMQWKTDFLDGYKTNDIEEVVCTVCDNRIDTDEVGLTRESLSETPPDILFTTTEMLNSHIGNNEANHLFGVGQGNNPILVLLDEVHTYGGSSGAQSAYLLRRWMQRSFTRPHFVGLSATLVDAQKFFSDLIGSNIQNVELIEPKFEEMVDEGAEYLLALRGDVVSQTALLSTTIQSSLLTRRILDNRDKISKGTWGNKAFLFTDDLEITNRLFFQLSDAEGWRVSYGQRRPLKHTLAYLRGPNNPNTDQSVRLESGQDWSIATQIGHSMYSDDRAIVARTSSQDGGVDQEAELIVASASLEVGFNDPNVGAVIQHKAPRDVASYLQRKGRAGRKREMRPWMVVILSEYGRDRIAFQRYEDLITPLVKRSALPLSNIHIQKMQGAMATLDWLSKNLKVSSVWSILTKPKSHPDDCDLILKHVNDLLKVGDIYKKYIEYLGYALDITKEDLDFVLWAPPRSLMLEFLPTLGRLLDTQWAQNGEIWEALREDRSPMPEFIPNALFSELNLPSLAIRLLRGQPNDLKEKLENLGFYQGLSEFSPGRISKRFMINSDFDVDWLIPNAYNPRLDNSTTVNFEIIEAFGNNFHEELELYNNMLGEITVYRPFELITHRLEREVGINETSNSTLEWNSLFIPSEQVNTLSPPVNSLSDYLKDITICSHQHMSPVEVVRYTTGSKAAFNFKDGTRKQVNFTWKLNGKSVGVGTRQWVDGIRLRFRLTDEVIDKLLTEKEVLKGLRPVFFRYLVEQLTDFSGDVFSAGWISECVMTGVLLEFNDLNAAQPRVIRTAIENLFTTGIDRLTGIPNGLFQSNDADGLHDILNEKLNDQRLQDDLKLCAEALWQEPSQLNGFKDWVKLILGNTLSATLLQTLNTLFPEIPEDSVFVDSFWDLDQLSIWVSESEPGGCGVINQLSKVYHDDPAKVLNCFVRNLQVGEYEKIDSELFYFLGKVKEKAELSDTLHAVRSSVSHQQRKVTVAKLHTCLQREGFLLSHSFLTLLHSRVLKPGSGVDTDSELFDYLKQWVTYEEESGFEWSINVVAYILSVINQKNISSEEIYDGICRVQNLLWPRGYTIRHSTLSFHNPFQQGNTLTERILGEKLLTDITPQINLPNTEWLVELHASLRGFGKVDVLFNDVAGQSEISKYITTIQLEPIDYKGLFLYPRLGGIRKESTKLIIRVELAEYY